MKLRHLIKPLALCLAALPAAAEEDRQETRLPEDSWQTRFMGVWAEDGRCDDPGKVWALSTNAVQMGRLNCSAIGKMTWSGDALKVPLSECREDEQPVRARTLLFREGPDETLVVTSGEPGDAETMRLGFCRD